MPKLILIPLATVLLLIVAAAILIPLLLDEEKVLKMAATTLYEETGATLTVTGETSLSLFPTIGIYLADAALALPGEKQPGLHARSLEIGVQLMPLFSGNMEVDSISLDGVSVRIESAAEQADLDTSKLSDEQLDAFYAKRRQTMAAEGDATGAEVALALPMALNVKQLLVTDSRLELVDSATGESTIIELVRLETTDLNLDAKPIPVDLQLRLTGKQAVDLDLEGNIRVDQQHQTVLLDAVSLVIGGVTAQPLKLQSSGTVDLSRQVADLQLALQVGATRGEGTLRYANFESPQIDTQLQLNLFDPALLALAGPEAAAEASGNNTAASGDEPLPLDAIRLIDTRADLTIEKAVFDAHTVNNMQVKLRAVDGVIDISTLTGDLHGGKLDLKATFDGKHSNAVLNTSGSLVDMDIATALAAA